MQIKINYDDIVTAVRILTSPSEDEFKKWLIKNLGEKYNDDIDTIVAYGKEHKSEYIGRYTIFSSPYVEKGKIIALNKKLPFAYYKPKLMIIDDPEAPHRHYS